MALLVAPYNNSMRIGQGFNSYTQKICIDNAVVVDPALAAQTANPTGKNQSSQIVSYSSRFVDKLSDVTDAMNIAGSLSIKYGAIGGSGSGAYIDSDKFKDSDLNFFISVKVVNQTINMKDALIFKSIKDLPAAKFTDTFGDSFISGFLEGGEFNALVSMKVLNKEKITDIKASAHVALTVGAGSIEADAKVEVAKSNLQNNTETTISVSWAGGGKLKDENVLWDVDSLTAVASRFPERVAETPQRTYAILTKYTALRSFVEQAGNFTPLDYENAGVYTSALLDAYMDYKNIWKLIQVASWEVDNKLAVLLPPAAKPTDGSEPYSTTLEGLDRARRDCRFQMISIVQEVDEITQNPKLAVDPKRPSPYISPIVFKQLIPIAKGPDPPAVPLPELATPAPTTSTAPPSDAADPSSTAPVSNSGICVWSYQGSARLIYQDSTGEIREACSSTQWKPTALNVNPKAKMSTPLAICNWGNEARLYYISSSNVLTEHCFSNGDWVASSTHQFDQIKLHAQSNLAIYFRDSPMTIHVYFQDPDNRIRVLQYANGWGPSPRAIATGLPGTGLAAPYAGASVRVMLRWPDGRLSWVVSDDGGVTYGNNPTLSESDVLKADSPLAGGAWQRSPRGTAAGPLDQIRAFYLKLDGSVGTYVIDDRIGKNASWGAGPATDNSNGRMAYLAWMAGGVLKQRLYLQKASREIMEYSIEGQDSNWSPGTMLPIV
ncbi:hypothetical protein B0O99DRAFT_739487 [Bisporella sp. PMI_857]|nr:hypothetical protein B0O99DRAFT_739487 [Bisporella sp. PMI_857]